MYKYILPIPRFYRIGIYPDPTFLSPTIWRGIYGLDNHLAAKKFAPWPKEHAIWRSSYQVFIGLRFDRAPRTPPAWYPPLRISPFGLSITINWETADSDRRETTENPGRMLAYSIQFLYILYLQRWKLPCRKYRLAEAPHGSGSHQSGGLSGWRNPSRVYPNPTWPINTTIS